jgi:hypothetical protein
MTSVQGILGKVDGVLLSKFIFFSVDARVALGVLLPVAACRAISPTGEGS